MKFSLQLTGIFILLFLPAECTTKREPHGRNRMKRQRQCPDGQREYKGQQCCKLCSPGFYAGTCSQNSSSVCRPCDSGSYLDHPNVMDSCELCTSCDPKANLETKEECTVTQNAVCTCKKGYYCDKGFREECKACHSCKKCEGDFVIEKQCTSTNDTVCKKVEGGGPWWIALIFLILGIVGVVGVWFLKKRKRFCFADKPKEYCDPGDQAKEIDEYIPLKGIDLGPHLNDIVEELGPKLTIELARGCLSDADIEFSEEDAQSNARDKSYKILRAWYEKQGFDDAAPNLIRGLRERGKKTTADKIINQILVDNRK
ncbi:hypothetical protein SKAU_G00149870 [Synaphobranchus kaupii]|uniref:Tumor necrosis factor receptor superfamily member 6 n=1 Tax=Synaphobranchus kaupii TaxID=118154 RepID=A0A9Q1J4U3_SYNKA|nr:hypothetical protein SKAU_G00149870 [Synaphobranchus kaupii]